MLTSSEQQADKARGRQFGVTGYLAKPIRREDLNNVTVVIEAELERHRRMTIGECGLGAAGATSRGVLIGKG
jgi:AmiR/NasT family two-component response regulator